MAIFAYPECRKARALLHSAIVGLLAASAASAQTLDQICPNAPAGIGALYGAVMDSDAEVTLPGATVVASWDAGGQEQRAEVGVGVEGFYAMCLPLETGISVYASFAAESGAPLELTMTEVFTRQDLSLSLSGESGEGDRLWLCVEGGESVINIRFSRLVRCDQNWKPLEQCPKEELGQISVKPVGAGSGMLREMIEQVVKEAKRLGANAVINVHDGRGGTSFTGTQHATSILGEAVRIDVDPSTC